MKKLFIAVVSLVAPMSSLYANFTIGKDGPPGVIVIDAQAPGSVQLAAKELQHYLQKATGRHLEIAHEKSDAAKYAIYLGSTSFAREKAISAGAAASDGFRIVTGEDWMIVTGRDYAGPPMIGHYNPFRYHEIYNERLKIGAHGETGTLNGVYHFLNDQVGVRWYMPGELGEVVPKERSINVSNINISKAPAFEYRYAYFCFFSISDEDVLWYKRVGFGGRSPVQIIHTFGEKFIKYKDTNPEYFAIIDGQPDFTTRSTAYGPGNINLANEGLIQQAIDDAKTYFDENPNQRIYPLVPNDGMRKISEDPESQSQIDHSMGEGGKFSNYVWGFVNKVAIELAKTHPDRYIGCIAYEHYHLPPANIAKLSPNVAVMITKQRRTHYDPKQKETERDFINRWKEKAESIYVWEYYCDSVLNSGWEGYPVFYPEIIKNDLEFLKGTSKGEFIEAEYWKETKEDMSNFRLHYPGLQHLRLYVTARLLWDPSQDVQAMIDEYCSLFYGSAAKPMKDFWAAAEKAWMERRSHADSPSAVYTTAQLNEMIKHLEHAVELTEKGSPYRNRVELILTEFLPATENAARLEKLSTPDYTLQPIADSLSVNATLAHPAWANSEVVRLLDRSYSPGIPATHVRVVADKEGLIFNFTCFEDNLAGLHKVTKPTDDAADSAIWNDDSIELFIAPENGGPRKAYQVIVNAAGAHFEVSYRDEHAGSIENDWKGSVTAAAREGKGQWVAEVKVPWKSIGIDDPKDARNLKMNFFRNRRAGGTIEQYSWAPLISGRYYNPESFGKLIIKQ